MIMLRMMNGYESMSFMSCDRAFDCQLKCKRQSVVAMSGGHMSESSLRRERGVEPDGAPRLAVRTALGPTCGGERRTQANPATPGAGRRSPPPAKLG